MESQNESEKLYYSISEVAEKFKLNESTLRFWEKEFDIIAPRKTGNGVRFYTKEDIKNIALIYRLLKEKGMTLAGAKKKLKENKDGTVRTHEVVQRLQDIRAELLAIRDELP
ncbi:MAG: MerR family transcriptional regulator [Bacteroidales bacterium]